MPVYPHAGGLGVVAIGTDTPGTSTDNPGAGALIFGHELVHDYDVKHTDVSGDCGSDDDTSDFPYTSASIQEFGFNTTTGKVYDPSNTHDLMSYCPAGGSRQGWISPFTWSRMYNNLAPSGVAVAAPAPAALGPALVVNAAIDNPTVAGGASAFGTLYRVEADVPTTPPPPGDYAIVLKDSIGGELARVPFAVSFESEYSAPGTQAHSHSPFDPPHVHGALDPGVGDPAETPLAWVSLTIPWADGTTQIVLEKGGQVLDTRSVSANPPAVQVASPNAPAVWPAGSTQTISWSATDPDGGALSYALFYAADGVSWELLAEGITGTSYQVPVDALRRLTSVRRVLKGSPARPTRFRWTRWPAARRPGSAWWRVTA
ncbi:MAG TPA: hypothetical protein VNL77_06205, partial [Roseiflexaceae bacterium]|nr:hypothetical protein [Roseiflexaceae bacterium]